MTIEAIGRQTKLAYSIVDNGADYSLSVQENPSHWSEVLHDLFEIDAAISASVHPYANSLNIGHGRHELQECGAIDPAAYLADLRGRKQWARLKTMVRRVSERRVADKVERKTRKFISKLPRVAKTILQSKLSH